MNQVLTIDDQVGDLLWLLDLIRSRGYGVVTATNEKEGRERLQAVKAGEESYSLAIIDVMMSTHPIEDLVDLDEKFFEESRDTGIRLCRYARKELGISPQELPIACLTVRDDDDVSRAMGELDIPLFNRVPQSPEDSIRRFIEERLPLQTGIA